MGQYTDLKKNAITGTIEHNFFVFYVKLLVPSEFGRESEFFEKFVMQWFSTHLKKSNQWYDRTQFCLLCKISFVPYVYRREFSSS